MIELLLPTRSNGAAAVVSVLVGAKVVASINVSTLWSGDDCLATEQTRLTGLKVGPLYTLKVVVPYPNDSDPDHLGMPPQLPIAAVV